MSQQEKSSYRIPYPRFRFRRGISRFLGNLALPLLCRIEIIGKELYPRKGPLIVVANHEAVMESVMLAILPPWQIEMIGSIDIPHEKLTDVATRFYGYIPIRRGRMERESLEMALDVMRQEGIVGVYPEGGIWDAGAMRAQTGVAWLSYRGSAPILPIAFSGTKGALGAMARLERPKLTMRIGDMIPRAQPTKDIPRKRYFQQYAMRVMESIKALIPKAEQSKGTVIRDERFDLQVSIMDQAGKTIDCPEDLKIQHEKGLAKVLHRPGILKIFTSNLKLPTEHLETLAQKPSAQELELATKSVLKYLDEENPYLFTYRFGPKEAESMHLGLKELQGLAQWAAEHDYQIELIPIRRFYLDDDPKEIVQTEQNKFEDWM